MKNSPKLVCRFVSVIAPLVLAAWQPVFASEPLCYRLAIEFRNRMGLSDPSPLNFQIVTEAISEVAKLAQFIRMPTRVGVFLYETGTFSLHAKTGFCSVALSLNYDEISTLQGTEKIKRTVGTMQHEFGHVVLYENLFNDIPQLSRVRDRIKQLEEQAVNPAYIELFEKYISLGDQQLDALKQKPYNWEKNNMLKKQVEQVQQKLHPLSEAGAKAGQEAKEILFKIVGQHSLGRYHELFADTVAFLGTGNPEINVTHGEFVDPSRSFSNTSTQSSKEDDYGFFGPTRAFIGKRYNSSFSETQKANFLRAIYQAIKVDVQFTIEHPKTQNSNQQDLNNRLIDQLASQFSIFGF